MATSFKQATCIKQVCIQFPKVANTLKCICIKPIALRAAKTLWSLGHSECNRVKQALCFKQADFDYPLGACLIQVVLYTYSEKIIIQCMAAKTPEYRVSKKTVDLF